MSALFSYLFLAFFQLSLLQPDLYYDRVVVPEGIDISLPHTSTALRAATPHSHSGFSAGITLPNYRQCFNTQDPAACLDKADNRPRLEMGSDKWKLGAKINLDEIKLKLKFPLQ
jgi:hypothetical protein